MGGHSIRTRFKVIPASFSSDAFENAEPLEDGTSSTTAAGIVRRWIFVGIGVWLLGWACFTLRRLCGLGGLGGLRGYRSLNLFD